MDPDPALPGQIEQVEQQYAQNPDGLVFARLADLYRRDGDPERGLEVLDHGLEKNPDYAGGHVVRGRCLRALGRDGAAEESFRRVLELDAQNQLALRNLGDLALEKGDREAAARWFEELIELDPGNEAAREALAELRDPGAAPGSEAARGDAGGGSGPGEAGGSPTVDGVAPDAGRAVDEGPPPGSEVSVDGEDASARGWDAIALEGPSASGEGTESDQEEAAGDGERGDPPQESGTPPDVTSEASLGSDGGGDGEQDLLTRTLANLYATQGLYDEAAEMYRELLVERPDDDELRARLAEVREAAGHGTPVSAPEAARPVGEDTAAGADGMGPADGMEPVDEAPTGGEPSAASRPEGWRRSVGAVEPPSMTMEQHLRELLRGEAVPGLVNRRLDARGGEGTPPGGTG